MLLIERLEEIFHESYREVIVGTGANDAVLEIIKSKVSSDGDNGFLNILDLISDVKEEVANCDFRRPDRREKFLKQLLAIQDGLLTALTSGEKTALRSWIFQAQPMIAIMSASVTEAMAIEVYDLDRPGFISHTQELIADVSDWPIDDFAKRNLLLSLNLVCQQVQAEAGSSSDAEVRRKIKMVVASFAIEFAELDKEFETRWEKIKRWARLGYKGASVPLGLTSDASAVVALLEAPK